MDWLYCPLPAACIVVLFMQFCFINASLRRFTTAKGAKCGSLICYTKMIVSVWIKSEWLCSIKTFSFVIFTKFLLNSEDSNGMKLNDTNRTLRSHIVHPKCVSDHFLSVFKRLSRHSRQLSHMINDDGRWWMLIDGVYQFLRSWTFNSIESTI